MTTAFLGDSLLHLKAEKENPFCYGYCVKKTVILLIDLESSHADTYSQQESASYKKESSTVGLHPLSAFHALTGNFLEAAIFETATTISPLFLISNGSKILVPMKNDRNCIGFS